MHDPPTRPPGRPAARPPSRRRSRPPSPTPTPTPISRSTPPAPLRARPSLKTGSFYFRKANPFARVLVRDDSTPAAAAAATHADADAGVAPVWDGRTALCLPLPAHKRQRAFLSLVVEVWDGDAIFGDSLLGAAEVHFVAQKACSSRLAVPLNLPGSGSSNGNGSSGGGSGGGGGGANGDFQQGAAAVLERLATAAGEEEAEARAAAAPAGELYMEVEIGEAQGSTTQGGPAEAGAEAGAEAKAEGTEPPTATPGSPLRERESRDYADFVARQSTSTAPPLVWATASDAATDGVGRGLRFPWHDPPVRRADHEHGRAKPKVTPAQSPTGGAYVVDSGESAPNLDEDPTSAAVGGQGGAGEEAAPAATTAEDLISSMGLFISRYR